MNTASDIGFTASDTINLIESTQCWGPKQENVYDTDLFPIGPYSEALVVEEMKKYNPSVVDLNKIWNTQCPGSDIAFVSKRTGESKGIQVKANVYYPDQKTQLVSNMFRNWNKKQEWKMDYSLSLAFEALVDGTAEPFEKGSIPTASLFLLREDFYNGTLDRYRTVRISYDPFSKIEWANKPHIEQLRANTHFDFDHIIKYIANL